LRWQRPDKLPSRDACGHAGWNATWLLSVLSGNRNQRVDIQRTRAGGLHCSTIRTRKAIKTASAGSLFSPIVMEKQVIFHIQWFRIETALKQVLETAALLLGAGDFVSMAQERVFPGSQFENTHPASAPQDHIELNSVKPNQLLIHVLRL